MASCKGVGGGNVMNAVAHSLQTGTCLVGGYRRTPRWHRIPETLYEKPPGRTRYNNIRKAEEMAGKGDKLTTFFWLIKIKSTEFV